MVKLLGTLFEAELHAIVAVREAGSVHVPGRAVPALSLDSGGDNPTGEWQGRQGAQPLVFAIGAMQDGSHRVICDVLEQQGWVRQQLESKVRDPAPPHPTLARTSCLDESNRTNTSYTFLIPG